MLFKTDSDRMPVRCLKSSGHAMLKAALFNRWSRFTWARHFTLLNKMSTSAAVDARMRSFATPSTISAFPMALGQENQYGSGETPRSVVELQIMKISGAIRDKPRWWEKVNNATITERWRSEVNDTSEQGEAMFRYALAECQWLASQYAPGPAYPAAVDNVFGRDDMDASLRERLVEGITKLRSLPAVGSAKEDRHPGTPEIIDLVHPSLYAYEQSKTPVLVETGADALKQPDNWKEFVALLPTTTVAKVEPSREEVSSHYQSASVFSQEGIHWLPSEFYVDSKTKTCQINSYINSLHPMKHPELYKDLGELFLHTLPAFERVLSEITVGPEMDESPAKNPSPRERPLRVPIPGRWWVPEGDGNRTDDEDDDDDDFSAFQGEFQTPIVPTLFEAPSYADPPANVSLVNRPLQVIVKIVQMEIEAGKVYDGGVWHVEGMMDERIVATACCYVDSKNVQNGDLGFYTAICEPDYEQDDRNGVFLMYDLTDEEPLVQNRGQCSTVGGTMPNGRILVWPNTLQHRVGKVCLVDEEQRGHRTIVCFFLVDPTLRIRSTATVPPQPKCWIEEELGTLMPDGLAESTVAGQVAMYMDRGMTYEDAVERRGRLMDERRSTCSLGGDDDLFSREFSLCEH